MLVKMAFSVVNSAGTQILLGTRENLLPFGPGIFANTNGSLGLTPNTQLNIHI